MINEEELLKDHDKGGKLWYFKAGKFRNTSSGIFSCTYDKDEIYFSVYHQTFVKALKCAEEYVTEKWGEYEYVDVWYGKCESNWKITPITEFEYTKHEKNNQKI